MLDVAVLRQVRASRARNAWLVASGWWLDATRWPSSVISRHSSRRSSVSSSAISHQSSRRSLARLLFLFLAAAQLVGCTTSSVTGRSQFLMVSEQAALSGSASAYSSMIGQYQKKKKIETGTARVERVKEITNRLVAQAVRFRPDAASWNWEVQVIDEPKTVNAFCMAGGKMGIYSGFWEKIHATDDEIAAVMGHEIGHALADHTRERMSIGMATGLGATILAAIVSRDSPYSFQRNQAAYGTAATLAVTLPNSREGENEADQIGIELAARAGYDPRAAVTLWQKMAKESGGGIEFLSTHPSPENRQERLSALVAKVDPLYQAAKDGKSTADIPMFVSYGGPPPVRYVSKDDPPDAAQRGTHNPLPITHRETKEEYAARVASEGQVMTFVAEEFERFKRGDVVFTCTLECALAYAWHRGDWKRMHEKQQWRELAVGVVKAGYLNDLTYFYLGEAAKGLKLLDAAKGEKTCAGGLMDTCDGFDVARLARGALAK